MLSLLLLVAVRLKCSHFYRYSIVKYMTADISYNAEACAIYALNIFFKYNLILIPFCDSFVQRFFQHSDEDDDDNVNNILKSKQWTVSSDVVHNSYIQSHRSFHTKENIEHENMKRTAKIKAKIFAKSFLPYIYFIDEDRLKHLWFYVISLLNTVPSQIICHQQFLLPTWTKMKMNNKKIQSMQ